MPSRDQTMPEEVANSLAHLVGFGLSIAILVKLVVGASDPWRVVSFSIYGSLLIFLYGSSALYHALPNVSWKRVMCKVDHAAIFLLIAGTYTPFMLVPLRGGWGWSIFGVVWGLSLVGLCATVLLRGSEYVRIALYILLGWLILIAIVPVVLTLPFPAIVLLTAGGLSYTGGVLFFLWERLPFHHTIWHAFVLAGSACHFLALLIAT